MRFGCIHQPRGKHHFDGPPAADQLNKPLSAPITGNKPKIYLWLTKTGVPGAKPEMTRHRQLQATTKRKTIHRRRNRLGTGGDAEKDIVTPGRKRLTFL